MSGDMMATPTAQVKIDNADLYQNIGDLVIALAIEGNKECIKVYKTAFERTKWDAEDGS
jgi:hypothetical protein